VTRASCVLFGVLRGSKARRAQREPTEASCRSPVNETNCICGAAGTAARLAHLRLQAGVGGQTSLRAVGDLSHNHSVLVSPCRCRCLSHARALIVGMNKGFGYTPHTDRGPHEATRSSGGIIEHDRAKQAGQGCVVAFRRKNEQGFLRQGVSRRMVRAQAAVCRLGIGELGGATVRGL
jgi:hypothetical protein